jgi:sphingolipid delta-4 desaturase
MIVAYNLRAASLPVLLFFTYLVSGTINHMMTLAVHELSHNLGFKTRWMNRYLAIFANIPMGIPAAVQFKRYHLEHHKYQGEDMVDVDIPTAAESRLFQSRAGKCLWMFLQPAFYALRPLVTNPKAPGKWEFLNAAVIVAANAAVYHYAGVRDMT